MSYLHFLKENECIYPKHQNSLNYKQINKFESPSPCCCKCKSSAHEYT